MTNYENIKNMSLEQVAEVLYDQCDTISIRINNRYCGVSKETYIKWLESEVEDDR